MRAPFFITGLPRSRTAWLANLFTWGDSFCYHDILPQCGSIEELDNKLREIPNCLQVGLSDSSLLLIWKSLMNKYPAAKWIIVKRDAAKACDSFIRYFQKHPYDGMPPMDIGAAAVAFQIYARQLAELESSLWVGPAANVIEFEDLKSYEVCRDLLRNVSNEYLSRERWELLNSLRVNTFSEGRSFERSSTIKFKRLLNECVLAGDGIETLGGTAVECGVGCALPELNATELVHNESH